MRRRIEAVAAWLPRSIFITLMAAIFTLLFANLTDSWLPGHFISVMQKYVTTSGAGDSGQFCRFVVVAVLLYVFSLSACGLITALSLRATLAYFWRLTGH